MKLFSILSEFVTTTMFASLKLSNSFFKKVTREIGFTFLSS